MKTYNEIYLNVRKQLRQAGIDEYALEARLLVSAAAGKSKEEFFRDLNIYAPDETEAAVLDMTGRRLAGEPAAYVLGEWEFMGLPFEVDRDVLIPRPDTETLAELAISLVGTRKDTTRLLDLCSGSGCIGISVASRYNSCKVVLVDNSLEALRLSRRNVRKNKVMNNVTCIAADALAQPPMLLGKYDFIVCNPPYIPSAEIDTLDTSVKDFEPRAALDGGTDGLDFYRSVTSMWKNILKPGGCMMFEVGEDQASAVRDMLTAEGFTKTGIKRDPRGVERVVAGIL